MPRYVLGLTRHTMICVNCVMKLSMRFKAEITVWFWKTPAPPRKSQNTRSCHAVTCPVRALQFLRTNQENLLEFLTSETDIKLADFAYTMTAHQIHEVTFRTGYVARAIEYLAQQLRADVIVRLTPSWALSKTPFILPCAGQGSLYAGMGRDLFRDSAVFRESILGPLSLCKSLGDSSVMWLNMSMPT